MREGAQIEMADADVRIKQFDPDDLGALLSFLRRTGYPDDPRKSEPGYWRWHFLETPGTRAGGVPVWLIRAGAEVLGQVGGIPFDLKVGDEATRALWLLDLVIDERLRGRGLGKGLVRAALAAYPTILALGYNRMSEPVLLRLGWRQLGGLKRYHKLLYPGDALSEVAGRASARAGLNLAFAPFRPRTSRLRAGARGEVREVSEFDESFDGLWREASAQWPCATSRTSRYLDWQFRRQPSKIFDVLAYRVGGRLRGYAVLFFRAAGPSGVAPKAAISDLCYAAEGADETVEELLKAALRLALDRRAGGIVTDVLDTRVERALARHGFRRVKRAPQFMAITETRFGPLVLDPRNWFLTRADCDVSIFEQPNLPPEAKRLE
jgi:RimJ/RimL family protein N-acetyltransferase